MALVLFGMVDSSRVECGVFTFPHHCVCCEAVGDPQGEEHITLALCHHTPLIRLTVGGG